MLSAFIHYTYHGTIGRFEGNYEHLVAFAQEYGLEPLAAQCDLYYGSEIRNSHKLAEINKGARERLADLLIEALGIADRWGQ